MVLGVLTGIDSVAAAVPSREGEPYSQLLPSCCSVCWPPSANLS